MVDLLMVNVSCYLQSAYSFVIQVFFLIGNQFT